MKSALVALALAGSLSAGAVTTVSASPGPNPCITNFGYGLGFTGGDGSTSATASATTEFEVFDYIGSEGCAATVTADLVTPGPERPGFLVVQDLPNAYDEDPQGGKFYLNGTEIVSCGAGGGGGCTDVAPFMAPIMLGTTFEIELTSVAFIATSEVSGGGSIQVTFSIEDPANAYNPVPIFFATPEPATWLLTAAGLSGLLIRRPRTQS
jgi:hypothetical protein